MPYAYRYPFRWDSSQSTSAEPAYARSQLSCPTPSKTVSRALPPRSSELTAVSKFVLGCEKTGYLYAESIHY